MHGLRAATGLVLISVVGCARPIATTDPSTPDMGAVLGPVTISIVDDARPCVFVTRADGTRLGLIWQDELHAEVSGRTVLANGKVIARDGDTVWLGGGTLPGVHAKLAGCPVTGTFVASAVFGSLPVPTAPSRPVGTANT